VLLRSVQSSLEPSGGHARGGAGALSRGQRAGEPLDRDTRCNGMGLYAADAGAGPWG